MNCCGVLKIVMNCFRLFFVWWMMVMLCNWNGYIVVGLGMCCRSGRSILMCWMREIVFMFDLLLILLCVVVKVVFVVGIMCGWDFFVVWVCLMNGWWKRRVCGCSCGYSFVCLVIILVGCNILVFIILGVCIGSYGMVIIYCCYVRYLFVRSLMMRGDVWWISWLLGKIVFMLCCCGVICFIILNVWICFRRWVIYENLLVSFWYWGYYGYWCYLLGLFGVVVVILFGNWFVGF